MYSYAEISSSALDPVVWIVTFVLLAVLLVGFVFSQRRTSARPTLARWAVLAVTLAGWVGCAWFLAAPVHVSGDDSVGGGSVACASPVRAAQIIGVPDDSSLEPIDRKCRTEGRIRLAGLLALESGIVAGGCLLFRRQARRVAV
jgi:hypothetical protein